MMVQCLIESEGEIRRTIGTLWPDFDLGDMTCMWPTPTPDAEGPGDHIYLVVDFPPLVDPLHQGMIAVLGDAWRACSSNGS